MGQKDLAIGLKISVLSTSRKIISLCHSFQKKQHHKLQRDLANARASQDQKKIDAAWQKWQQYCNDHRVYGPLVVDGMEFDNYEDFELNNGEYVMIGLPDVYQLEEWFELNRPGQVGK